MPKYRVYGLVSANVFGEVEADSKEEAHDKAWEVLDSPSLCHQCASEVELGDIYEIAVEEE